jgi:starvation-inducible DNA-binding protein
LEQLIEALKVVLANTHAMYMKTHGFHWNIVSNNFPQYHTFFDSLYNELWNAVDPIAEHIRACGGFSPATYSSLASLTTITEQNGVPSDIEMFAELVADNATVQQSIRQAYKAAEAIEELGVSNFLQDRFDVHSKHGWQLRSTVRSNP